MVNLANEIKPPELILGIEGGGKMSCHCKPKTLNDSLQHYG